MVKLAHPLSFIRQNSWEQQGDDKRVLWLLTPTEIGSYPDGVVVTSIFGDTKTVGEDYIDMDTRAGYTAWGIYEEAFL